MELDFDNDMSIDPDELDIAILEQANLASKYGRNLANCEKIAKQAAEKIKTVRANLSVECNQDPDSCLGKGNKATAVNVEAYYRSHSDHIEAKQEWIEAEANKEWAKIAYDAIAYQRKKSLELLVQLLQMEYFAGPSMPKNLGEAWKEKQSKNQEKGLEAATKGIRRRSK